MQTERNIWLRVLSMILTLTLLISCVPNQVYAMAAEALEYVAAVVHPWPGALYTLVAGN